MASVLWSILGFLSRVSRRACCTPKKVLSHKNRKPRIRENKWLWSFIVLLLLLGRLLVCRILICFKHLFKRESKCVCVYVHTYTYLYMSLVIMEAKRECQNSWNGSFRWLWATDVSAGIQTPSPLQEQQVLLTVDSSLQPKFCFLETGSHTVVQTGVELIIQTKIQAIFWPQVASWVWGYKCEPPWVASSFTNCLSELELEPWENVLLRAGVCLTWKGWFYVWYLWRSE